MLHVAIAIHSIVRPFILCIHDDADSDAGSQIWHALKLHQRHRLHRAERYETGHSWCDGRSGYLFFEVML